MLFGIFPPNSASIGYAVVVKVEVLLYVHRNRKLIRDGEPRTATSTFTQLLNSDGYATEGALFISAQLSTDVVSALRP